MPLLETEALVLRTYRLGEADKVVSLLTRQHGRLRAVASEAQRPKSRFGGTLEPLSYIRVWLFERENRDLLRINSADLIESFFAMQGDYRLQLAAQYLAESSERFLPEREVSERAFRLLLVVLRALKQSGEVDRPLLYFDHWLLRLSGLLPDLSRCAACGRALAGEAVYYKSGAQGFFCARCRAGGAALPGDVPAVAEKIRRLALDAWIASGAPLEVDRIARRLFETWIRASAEGKLLTLEMMAEEAE